MKKETIDSFINHLSRTKERVEQWPEWKKEALVASKEIEKCDVRQKSKAGAGYLDELR